MKDLIEKYILDNKNAWSGTTLTSERRRLLSIHESLHLPPEELWGVLKERHAPYTRVTIFSRVVSFYDWLVREGHVTAPNKYRDFKSKNKQLFKNTYERRKPSITFEEAKKRIKKLDDERCKNKALELLLTGMRFNESLTYRPSDGTVIGKGNKRRKVYNPFKEGVKLNLSYSQFMRKLKKVGIKPHDLRKLAASKLYNSGLNEFDLLKVMGWESIETAKSYIQSKEDEKLEDTVRSTLQSG